MLATRLIESSGAAVHVVGQAANGVAATEVIAETRPDVVLCDIRMPGMSGPDVVNAVRSRLPDQRFLFWSSLSREELQSYNDATGVPVLSKDRIEELPDTVLELAVAGDN